MMEEVKIFGYFMGVMGVFLVVLIIPLLVLFSAFSKAQCSDFQAQTGRETKYNFLNGCLVKTDQGWIAGENLIINSTTK